MKRKLCPFDKTECVGEACMAFCEDGRCGLVCARDPCGMSSRVPETKNPGHKKTDEARKEAGDKKSRYRAELFD